MGDSSLPLNKCGTQIIPYSSQLAMIAHYLGCWEPTFLCKLSIIYVTEEESGK